MSELTILVVEEDDDAAAALGALLSGLGRAWTRVGCARELVEVGGEIRASLALVSLGSEGALEALRSEPSLAGVPAVALVPRFGAENRDELLALGFDDFLERPVFAESLQWVLSAWSVF